MSDKENKSVRRKHINVENEQSVFLYPPRRSLEIKSRRILHEKGNFTPKVRELGFTSTASENRLSAEWGSFHADDFINISMNCFRLTALHGFQYDRLCLRKYAERLSAVIQAEGRKSGVLADTSLAFDVKFEVVNGIASIDIDNKAVKITIRAKDKSEKDFMNAFLVSRERNPEMWEQQDDADEFCVLPLLLVKGTALNIRSLIAFLKSAFSCNALSLKFSHNDLAWMIAMWAGVQSDNAGGLCMVYKTHIKEMDTIEYDIDFDSAYRIWQNIHDPDSDVMTIDEVQKFLEVVQKHFKTIFCVDLSFFNLTSIKTNAASVDSNGIIKISSLDSLPYVLRHLTNLAQEYDF